jgi:hypothetical protein
MPEPEPHLQVGAPRVSHKANPFSKEAQPGGELEPRPEPTHTWFRATAVAAFTISCHGQAEQTPIEQEWSVGLECNLLWGWLPWHGTTEAQLVGACCCHCVDRPWPLKLRLRQRRSGSKLHIAAARLLPAVRALGERREPVGNTCWTYAFHTFSALGLVQLGA